MTIYPVYLGWSQFINCTKTRTIAEKYNGLQGLGEMNTKQITFSVTKLRDKTGSPGAPAVSLVVMACIHHGHFFLS